MEFVQIATDLQQAITADQAWHYHILPIENGANKFVFYADESIFEDNWIDELELLFDKQIVIEKKPSELVQRTLSTYYRKTSNAPGTHAKYVANYQADDFLDKLIDEAHQIHSSDIHIEPYEERCRVRMRIDGKLIERYVVNKLDYPALVNKIKIKANLDISEKRLPQDGRIIFKTQNAEFDIRVSCLPTLHGEKIVLRLLSKDSTNININYLGFAEDQLSYYLEGIKKTHGIVLISGPTGSGKTTTLYATLKILNEEKTNILTIEDPIEYTLEGINQVQLKESIGLTFASALRTFLRQDPDIIMLGEIRDGETAQMAIRAALTGHLVLSTIHTNSAWGTVSRLVDMGVPPFLLASTLNLSIAQRLVRLLCPHCKQEMSFNESQFPRIYKAPRKLEKHYTAKGCDKCYYTGYKGRKAVYETIPINIPLAESIKAGNFNVSEILKENNISSLTDNAFSLLESGQTTIEEIYPILLNQL